MATAYSPQHDYFQLLFPFQLHQTAVRQTMEGFFVVLNCGVRILLVISVFRLVDRTHTKQPIHQLLPLMQKLPRAWRLGQNPLGWLWHQLQMS